MCSLCKTKYKDFLIKHEEASCPFQQNLFCPSCACCGHSLSQCPDPPPVFAKRSEERKPVTKQIPLLEMVNSAESFKAVQVANADEGSQDGRSLETGEAICRRKGSGIKSCASVGWRGEHSVKNKENNKNKKRGDLREGITEAVIIVLRQFAQWRVCLCHPMQGCLLQGVQVFFLCKRPKNISSA